METNIYKIVNNPLLYAETSSEIQSAVNEIYNQLKDISYCPATVELQDDKDINCGDIIRVNGKLFYVMKKELSDTGCVLTCSGSQERNKQSSLNSEIIATRGKTNTLTRTVESNSLILTDATGKINKIEQTMDGVIFQNNAGQTVINGSNITTGTISADRINMTGSVSWGDLTSSCQNTITNIAESSASSVPDYITPTYIDGARIVSPTIQGGTLSAGTTADGYITMDNNGLLFCSSQSTNNKPLIGMGYINNRYDLPYITLGGGIDAVGTDRGMIKKYTDGIWIGNSSNISSQTAGGTGIFIDFTHGKIYKYINGTKTQL